MEEKKKPWGLIVFLVIVVSLIIGVGGTYYYLKVFTNSKIETKTNETNNTTAERTKELDIDNPIVVKLDYEFRQTNFCGDYVHQDATNKNMDNNLKVVLAISQIPEFNKSYQQYTCDVNDFTSLGESYKNICNANTSPVNLTEVQKIPMELLESKVSEMFGSDTKIDYSKAILSTLNLKTYILKDSNYLEFEPNGIGGTCDDAHTISIKVVSAKEIGNDIVIVKDIYFGEIKSGTQTFTFNKDDNDNYIFNNLKTTNVSDSLKQFLNQ